MVGKRLAGYEITGTLGEGGMGTVFRARDVKNNRDVALKVLQPRYSKVEQVVRRFMNEATAAGATDHPGIVDVFEAGYDGDRAFMALELINGGDMLDLVENKGPLSQDEVARFGAQIGEALAAAHDRGIVHRDLKPDNVMLADEDGELRIKIVDFGLAKLLEDLGQAKIRTHSGVTVGTPTWMAPEQWQLDKGVDHRADLYALGCVLFYMACGRPPFQYEHFPEKMKAHLSETPPVPSSIVPAVGPDLDKVILKLLEKRPDDRYPDGRAVATALRDVGSGKAARAREVRETATLPATRNEPASVDAPAKPTVVPAAKAEPEPLDPVDMDVRSTGLGVWLVAGVIAIGAAVLVWVLMRS